MDGGAGRKAKWKVEGGREGVIVTRWRRGYDRNFTREGRSGVVSLFSVPGKGKRVLGSYVWGSFKGLKKEIR